MDTVVEDVKKSMDKTIKSYKVYLSTVKTGRARASLFENIMVESYDQKMPIKQLASISIPEATRIIIQPWDTSIIKNIEKAIMKANMGLTPQNDGKVVKINLPPMTEEDRKQVVKLLKKESEKYRINLRNARKKFNNVVKDMQKDKLISEDESKNMEKEIQKITDDFIKELNELTEYKQKEIMSI